MIEPSAPPIENKPHGSSPTDGDEADVCVICMEEIDPQANDRITLKCGHSNFHKECLKQWKIESKATCPMCRQRFGSSAFHNQPPIQKDLLSDIDNMSSDIPISSNISTCSTEDLLELSFVLLSNLFVFIALCLEPPFTHYEFSVLSSTALISYSIFSLSMTAAIYSQCDDETKQLMVFLASFFKLGNMAAGAFWLFMFVILFIIFAVAGDLAVLFDKGGFGPWHTAAILVVPFSFLMARGLWDRYKNYFGPAQGPEN